MRHYLIMSHGRLALGLKDTLEMFVGKREDISYVAAYIDDKRICDIVNPIISKLHKDDELIILTDLLGGSVNTEMMKYLSRPHTHLIAGFNYSLILELVTQTSQYLTKEEIEEIIKKSRQQMAYVNSLKTHKENGDEY
ncbi:PTS sugar transporter subunit IIA [Thermoanaerobacterium thermosaccharolyticum]|uniref:PTS sugar transporter subunit IIA n=1 Tax=Thermoanaerobacterium thermosaccharolyticum TaxID=1517 RepID=UPI00123B343D|nr:PTS N-acetylglucosamine transporter subunit IIBC [Thermoanaerobacterium thermosaccharolyticum]KAA5806024.1 PTS N-acetylglucosamine transporter subunit IIBC [Thermoanaerobacterium thermosaccharolyticum]